MKTNYQNKDRLNVYLNMFVIGTVSLILLALFFSADSDGVQYKSQYQATMELVKEVESSLAKGDTKKFAKNGMLGKSREEQEDIAELYSLRDPNFKYHLHDDLPEDSDDQEIPVFVFRLRDINFPYTVGEKLAIKTLGERAKIVQVTVGNIGALVNGDNKMNNETMHGLVKILENVPMTDYAMFEMINEESMNFIPMIMNAFQSKVRKSMMIIGNDINFEAAEEMLDAFLPYHRVWEPTRVPIAQGHPVDGWVVLANLVKEPENTPTFQLYQHLDNLHWRTSIMHHFFNQRYWRSKTHTPPMPSCNDQKYLVYKFEKKSFGNIVQDLTHLVTAAILLDRQVLMDSEGSYLYGQVWPALYLRISDCDELNEEHNVNINNTVHFGHKEMTHSKYVTFSSKRYDPEDLSYPSRFGFPDHFEYRAAIVNWFLRFNCLGRSNYRRADLSVHTSLKSYFDQPRCIAVRIGRESKKPVSAYLDAVAVIKKMPEFYDISSLFIMTDSVDIYKTFYNVSFSKHKVDVKEDMQVQIMRFDHSTSNPDVLATLQPNQRNIEGVILMSEIQTAAQCEVMIGSGTKTDLIVAQQSFAKYKKSVFFYNSTAINVYKSDHQANSRPMREVEASTNQTETIKVKSGSRYKMGIHRKPRPAQEKIASLYNKKDSNFKYHLHDDLPEEQENKPVTVYLFRTKEGNFPFVIAENLAKQSVHERATIVQVTIGLNSNLQDPDGKVNNESMSAVYKIMESLPMMEHAMFELVNDNSIVAIPLFMHIFESKVRKTMTVIGKDTHSITANGMLDIFLRVHRVWDDAKVYLVPHSNNDDWAVLSKIVKEPENSPAFQLYQHLDDMHWRTSEEHKLFGQRYWRAKTFDYVEPTCDDEKYIVYKIPSNSFGSVIEDMAHLVTDAIRLNRPILLDSQKFLYGKGWDSLFLSLSNCDETYAGHNAGISNIVKFGEDGMTEAKYVIYTSSSYDQADQSYPNRFGFPDHFEYRAAVVNWILRMNGVSRKGFKEAQFSIASSPQKYFRPPRCITLRMGVKAPSYLLHYLNSVAIVKKMPEFADIGTLFIMTDSSEATNTIHQINMSSHGINGAMDVQYIDFPRNYSSTKALVDLSPRKRLLEGVYLMSELQTAAQCEVIIGVATSKIDPIILQLSFAKYKKSVYFYNSLGHGFIVNNNKYPL
eukprot:gene12632-14835_t